MSNITEFLRRFTPPILIDTKRRISGDRRVFPDYDSALRQCGEGYNSAALAGMIVEKMRRHIQTPPPETCLTNISAMRSALAVGLAGAGRTTLNVVDFGGAAGAHYFDARDTFPHLKLRWHVVESEAMAKNASSLETDGLHFYSSIDEAVRGFGSEGADLLFSSGAFQYTPNPLDFLRRACLAGARSVYLTRAAVVETRQVTVIQRSSLASNGPGPLPPGFSDHTIEYPVTFCRKNEFEDVLKEFYRIKIVLNEEPRVCFVGKEWASMFGYYGKR